ncbi:hypothetical protein [Mameliella alba]|uniref:hypothetical protein n=2 Tax=Mameliella TaxID=1434019 RepID=UPI000B52FAA2|nr:hypothetical protein [Mameliella alba]OWV58335.1 hypothetical protein CDZ98_15050 [Mameliella alba]
MMAFGIQLFNDFGEEVLGGGRPLNVLHTGDSARFDQDNYVIGASGLLVASGGAWVESDYPLVKVGPATSDLNQAMRMWRFAAHGFTGVSWSKLIQTRNDYLPDTYAADVDDIVFWEMPPDGIIHSFNYWIDPPDASAPRKVSGICPNDTNGYSGLPRYCIGSINAPVDQTQSYGIQTFDASGNVLYDSRGDNIVVRDFRVFSQAEVQDVLENDTVVTFTPRAAPVGAPMVSLSSVMSFSKPANGRHWYYPLIEWDGTSFTLSRFRHSMASSSSLGGFAYSSFTLTVADAEW